MDAALKRDWLSGGFVPRHGGIGSFLPVLKPSPPQGHQQLQSNGTRSARNPRIAKSGNRSPRSAHHLTRLGSRSARVSRTVQAVAPHITSAMLDAMGAPAAPVPPAAVPNRRPTTRENARGLMCEHGLGQPAVTGADPTGRKVRESAGPVAALRAAKNIGLRAEVEHCAATVLQTVLRTRRPKNEISLHRAATSIQTAIRLRNDARNRRNRVAKMDDGAREEHKAKARQRELENMKRFFYERFQEWAMEQAQKQRQPTPEELQDEAQSANERQSAEDEERDRVDTAREAAMIRDRERLRQEHGHRRKRREQVLRQEKIDKRWEDINNARIESVESEQKRRVVQEKRSLRRLNHQILAILLESWRVHTAIRRRLERSNVAGMIPSSMLAIEKQIAKRKSQLKNDSEPLVDLYSHSAPLSSSEQDKSATQSSDSHSPGELDVIHSVMNVFQGGGKQILTRGFLVWKQWCSCLNADATSARSQSKLACLFRFYLAAARGIEFTSVSSSLTTAVVQCSADMDVDSSPSVSTGAPSTSEQKLTLVLEGTTENGDSDHNESGDYLPELGLGRGSGHTASMPVGEHPASPRLVPYSAGKQGVSPTASARSPAEVKLASYQLPSLALVRTSVPAISRATWTVRPSPRGRRLAGGRTPVVSIQADALADATRATSLASTDFQATATSIAGAGALSSITPRGRSRRDSSTLLG